MDNVMKGILSRVLSQELANQEKWQQKEVKEYGADLAERDEIKAIINKFMEENDIEFRTDYYFECLNQ